MREYVLHQSESLPSGLLVLWSRLRNWQTRRNFAKLAELSDYQLRDVGLTHADAVRLSILPLSVDPAGEADRLRLLNSRLTD